MSYECMMESLQFHCMSIVIRESVCRVWFAYFHLSDDSSSGRTKFVCSCSLWPPNNEVESVRIKSWGLLMTRRVRWRPRWHSMKEELMIISQSQPKLPSSFVIPQIRIKSIIARSDCINYLQHFDCHDHFQRRWSKFTTMQVPCKFFRHLTWWSCKQAEKIAIKVERLLSLHISMSMLSLFSSC